MQFYGLHNWVDRTIRELRYRIMRCSKLVVMLICVGLGFLRNFISSKGIVRSTNNFVYVLLMLLILIKMLNIATKQEGLIRMEQEITELEDKIAADERHKKQEHLYILLSLGRISRLFYICDMWTEEKIP